MDSMEIIIGNACTWGLFLAPPVIVVVHLWRAFRIWQRYTFDVAWRKVLLQSGIVASIYAVPSAFLVVLYVLDSDPPQSALVPLSIIAFPLMLPELLAGLLAPDVARNGDS